MSAKRSCQGCRGAGSCWLVMAVLFLLSLSVFAGMTTSHRKVKDGRVAPGASTHQPVQLKVDKNEVVMDNGIVQVTFSNPGGHVLGIKYGGIDNLLEAKNAIDNRGYLDLVWNYPGNHGQTDKTDATKFNITTKTDDIVEISFARPWHKSSPAYVSPFNIDKRFIMRRNVSGFYSYAIFGRPEGFPEVEIDQARVVYKSNGAKFHFMAISDRKQRVMPTASDRNSGKKLAYPEAVLLTNPSNPDLKGEVDDKYQYSGESQDDRVHGWISNDPAVGFWMISASDEFRTGGPIKQDLTSHVGPITLNTFMSTHYGGKEFETKFADGEPWKKVFGPFMLYFNSNPSQGDFSALWDDAKRQMLVETQSWPYDFIQSGDFLPSSQRGTVTGQLMIRDRYITKNDTGADSAYVGLAAPGKVGSWQTETKGYQFWARADTFGNFVINNVRPGTYNLYAWVPGIVGDYKYDTDVKITAGSKVPLGSLVYEPPRSGPTLWEIGVPDRTALEFYVPDASPRLVNKLYSKLKPDGFRQYGLWDRYAELYPRGDLVFNVGKSDYRKDWFFAQVTRSKGESGFVPTTWQVNFELEDVSAKGSYTLQLALASATYSNIEVRFNDPKMGKPLFETKLIGSDNAIARHGIHGLYHFYSIQVPGDHLKKGSNILSLTQSRAQTAFNGVMYDYLRFEGPSQK